MIDRDTTPAERIQDYLEWEDDSEDACIAAIHDDDGNRRSLQVADVRAVLAEHQTMRDTLAAMTEEWAFQYISYGVRETSLICDSREQAEHEASHHRNGDRIVRRLVGDWKPVDDA